MTFARHLKYLCCLFLIPLFSYGQEKLFSVCERTPQVKTAIMAKIAEIDSNIECSDDELIFPLLSEIKRLWLVDRGIDSLKAGDFSGLSSLQILNLSENQINSLPEAVFSGLSPLLSLDLSDNPLDRPTQNLLERLERIRREEYRNRFKRFRTF